MKKIIIIIKKANEKAKKSNLKMIQAHKINQSITIISALMIVVTSMKIPT